MKLKYCFTFFIALCLFSCTKTETATSRPEPIVRLDRFAARYPGVDSAQSVEMQPAVDILLGVLNSAREQPVSFDEYSRSDAVRIFQPDIERYLPSLDSVSEVLGAVRDRMADMLPSVRWRRLYGVVTPFRQSVVTSDSITLVGLNHYLGAGYKGYGAFDSYVRRLKTPDRLPIDVAEATIAADCPFSPSDDPVALERMLYEGAVVYALAEIIPDSGPRDILAYTPRQWQWALDNEAEAWAALASRGLLYSTDETVSAKLNNPSPATFLLNQDAPGMYGRFIGYRIVDSYMKKNPSAVIDSLLTPQFYNSSSTLLDSGYSPERR